ncbi:MAG: glycosyltransferase family 2 protein [Beijerinckiaceae bacterium]
MISLVSVVIPAYNAQRYIARTLRSALNQTHGNIEIIVVDDGSTDQTRHIVESFTVEDSRVRLIGTVNRGVARARNRGIEDARGTYLAFLDADDLWHPTKIERQLQALNAHASDPTWAAVYAYSRSIDEEDRVIHNGRFVECRGFILARHIAINLVGNGSTLLVRRDAALSVGGYDSSYAAAGIGGCEDLDFELKLAARYRIEAVSLFLVGYRVHEERMSSDRCQMAQSLIAVVARHIEKNSHFPPRIRRWATAKSHRFAAKNFLMANRLMPAMRAYWTLLLNDPASAVIFVAKDLPLDAIRKAMRVRSIGPASKNRATAFLPMNPEAGHTNPSTLVNSRLKRMAADDRMLEDRALPQFAQTEPYCNGTGLRPSV